MIRGTLLIAVLLVLVSTQAVASDEKVLVDRAKRVASSEKALRQAVESGSQRIHLCKFCHGVNGNSVRPEVPNLAGQSPYYLLRQLVHFSTGHRRNNMMQDIAPSLNDEDRINVVLYYSTQRVKKRQPGSGSAKGRRLYQKNCAECHGQSALGTDNFPRLATQQPQYLQHTLMAVKSGHRQRPLNPDMIKVIGRLSVDDIDDIVSYLAAMKAAY